MVRILTLLAVLPVTLVILALLLSDQESGWAWLSVPIVASGIGWMVVAEIRRRPCLRSFERRIATRLADLDARRMRVQEAVNVAACHGSQGEPSHQATCRLLAQATAALRARRSAYGAKVWELELIRWQNLLEPLAASLGLVLDAQTCRSLIEYLQAVRLRGVLMVRSWTDSTAVAAWVAQPLLDRTRPLLETCKCLKNDLIARHAAFAVQGISAIADVLPPLTPPLPAPALARLEDFTEGLEAVEREYQRLMGEEEVERLLAEPGS